MRKSRNCEVFRMAPLHASLRETLNDAYVLDRDTNRVDETIASVTAAVLTALYGAPSIGAESNAPAATGMLEEVSSPRPRRAVSAQDLPISITAVTGTHSTQAGVEDVAELAHSMAGVNSPTRVRSAASMVRLIIRGLNSEQTQVSWRLAATPVVPPVATYVDDTPLFFNLRLQDLDRVEVLRGPQGTLYGSGSLGGTIRYVQNAPDPSGFDAQGAEVGLSDTQHTHAPNEECQRHAEPAAVQHLRGAHERGLVATTPGSSISRTCTCSAAASR